MQSLTEGLTTHRGITSSALASEPQSAGVHRQFEVKLTSADRPTDGERHVPRETVAERAARAHRVRQRHPLDADHAGLGEDSSTRAMVAVRAQPDPPDGIEGQCVAIWLGDGEVLGR